MLACGDSPPRPHIVIFLADDLGWADVGFHGSPIPTPNIDQLAQNGAVLAQFYVEPLCVPARAGLMTGRYPLRYGLQERGRELPLAERTLAEALREAGYRTALLGKWDLGFISEEQRPNARGFDHHYGHYHSSIDSFEHTYLGGLDWHRNDETIYEEGYSTTLLGDEAVRLIEGHDVAQPLFLLMAFNAPHAPLAAPEHCLSRMGPREDDAVWGRRMYGAMVVCMDDQVGRVLAALDARGMRDDSLVFFLSDNGGDASAGAQNTPLKGGKLSPSEGGVRAVAVAEWRGAISPGTLIEESMHVTDLYPTLVGLAGGTIEQALPLDGRDVWPAIANGAPTPHAEIPIGVGKSGGVLRSGKWKLFADYGTQATPVRVELYDLSEDPAETRNLARREPEIVRDLLHRLSVYRGAAVSALPPPRYPLYEIPAVWGADDTHAFPDGVRNPRAEQDDG